MIGGQALVLQMNTIGIDDLNLVIADAEPTGTSAHQITVKANGVDEWNKRRISQCADASTLQVVYLDPDELGQIENLFRHAATRAILLENNQPSCVLH